MKEHFRKFLVSLKRNPQNIALVAAALTFLFYSLNLKTISDTTAKIQGANMGLSGFITMLLSILSLVCFLNVFPKRKKPNYLMLALVYAMYAIMIVCDINYRYRIQVAKDRPDFASVLEKNPYIDKALGIVTTHIVLLVIVAILIALVPVFKKLLKKINTSVEVEGNSSIGVIDVDEE